MPRASNRSPRVLVARPEPIELGPALDFMRSLWRLNHAMELTSGHMERVLGITAQQRMIIRCIGKRPGIAPSQLAALLHLDRSTISSALNRMERDKLLTRRCDSEDRRSVTLWLSKSGKRLDQPTKETLEHAVERMFERTQARDRLAVGRVMACLAEEMELVLASPAASAKGLSSRNSRLPSRAQF